MPAYTWVCRVCGREEMVVRSVSEIDIDPSQELVDQECKHEWERVISSGIRKNYGWMWGGRKGEW